MSLLGPQLYAELRSENERLREALTETHLQLAQPGVDLERHAGEEPGPAGEGVGEVRVPAPGSPGGRPAGAPRAEGPGMAGGILGGGVWATEGWGGATPRGGA